MFVQYLTSEAQNMTKLERKPRRNIQYKDIGKLAPRPLRSRLPRVGFVRSTRRCKTANAAAHQENLEFLEDVVPKTTTYREIKGKAAAARARVTGEKVPEGAAAADERPSDAMPNGKRAKPTVNGNAPPAAANGLSRSRVLSSDAADPSDQLELEMRQAQRANDDEDVDMAG
jgi:hypothetical protein